MPDTATTDLNDRLRTGQLSLCMRCTLVTGPQLAPLVSAAGLDVFYVDLEHSATSLQDAARTCAASVPLAVTGLVRIPEGANWMIGPLLDEGAQGIIAPHIQTAEQARAVVAACRYPPAGERSVTGLMPQTGYRAIELRDVADTLNPTVTVIVMIESSSALENVEEIAAVDGIDLVLVGTSDLSMEFGVPGEHGHERIREAYRKVASATAGRCRFGVAGVSDPEVIKDYVELGARFVSVGRDVDAFLAGARNQIADFSRVKGDRE